MTAILAKIGALAPVDGAVIHDPWAAVLGYGVDLFVPLIPFGAPKLQPIGLWGVVTGLIRITGFILTGILVVTYTGYSRRE